MSQTYQSETLGAVSRNRRLNRSENLGSLDGRCRGGTLERLARDQPVLGQVERHGYKLADLAH